MKKLNYILPILLSCLVLISCNKKSGAKSTSSMKLTTVKDDNFNQLVLESDMPVVVDFWAAWCGPCRQMEPELQQLAAKYKGKVKFVKIDIDRNEITPINYGVYELPTILFFKDGQTKGKLRGLTTKGTVDLKINQLLLD